MEIAFVKDPLVAQQNSYVNKIVNDYFVYDLDSWQRNLLNNFTLKNY